MKNREVIEDSLDFCKDIQYYETDNKTFLFDSSNYSNLKEYIKWIDHTDSSISKDYVNFEDILDMTEWRPSIVNEGPVEIEDTMDKMPQSSTKSILSFIKELLICLVISISVVLLVSNFVVSHTRVVGQSMENTLHNDEYLLVNRFSYLFGDPKQFDIIIFEHTDDEKYIKRVIACPNQTVQIVDGNIYVDGEVLNENYGNATIEDPGIAKDPIRLSEDEYFVLGDNRNHSSDSRVSSVGLIKRDKIQGKVLLRFYPFNKFGTVE